MSYTIQDAKIEVEEMIESALNSTDSHYVADIADKLANMEGYEEDAQTLKEQARKLYKDEWAYDESINN